MTSMQLTLWETVEALSRQTPFTKAKVQSALSTSLGERAEPSNDAFHFFVGGPLELKDGVVLSKTELRVKRDGASPGFLMLELEGACIRVIEVRRHYSTLEITATPRGHSLDEATTYSATQSWGELSFGFKERNPECLAYIVFKPRVV